MKRRKPFPNPHKKSAQICVICGSSIDFAKKVAHGGDTYHFPPEYIESRQAMILQIEKIIHAGSKTPRERYRDFVFYYRFISPNASASSSDFLSITDKIIKEEPPRSLTVQFIIPATSLEKGQKLEYKLSSEIDGHENILQDGSLRTLEQKSLRFQEADYFP